jgi:hypothetical protein
MRLVTAFALLVLFVALASSETHYGHHNHHKPPTSDYKNCHYQTDKGSYDLRLLMRDMNGKDWELRDEKTGSTFFFNPCGGVQNKACPAGAALCEITDKDQNMAISYGNAAEITWAEGQENSVELTYANGEKCDNGIPRKALLQMTCSKPTADKMTQQTVITDMTLDDCMVTLKMQSPYACAVEQLCSIYDKEECEASQGLCAWQHEHDKAGKCAVTTTDCFQFGRHHLSLVAVIGLFGGISVLAFCGMTLCCCVCCARRRRANIRTLPTKVKKSKAAKEQEMQEVPQPQFIYQPLQQIQGYPGNYTEFNPYAQVQFIPNTSVQN